jgi:hypothetical protein
VSLPPETLLAGVERLSAAAGFIRTALMGHAGHLLSAEYAWHGRLMVLGWGIAIPLGILAARYFKVTGSQHWPERLDNKSWWHAHLVLQIGGVACMTLGLVLLLLRIGRLPITESLHVALGWIVAGLGWCQLLAGFFRGSKGGPVQRADASPDPSRVLRGDHYDMTRWRVAFEWSHKIGGYLALLLSVITIGLGLARADAPKWMWAALVLWWLALLVVATRLQRSGRCIDTYQAIWGPDAWHPGAARRPIGLGIERYTADQFPLRYGKRPPALRRNSRSTGSTHD